MSNPTDFDEEKLQTNYRAPYSNKRPLPTVQRYREHRQELSDQQKTVEAAQHGEEDDSKAKRAFNSVKHIVKDEDNKHPEGDPYPTANRHARQTQHEGDQDANIPLVPESNFGADGSAKEGDDGDKDSGKSGQQKSQEQTATEKVAGHTDPKEKRKEMKHSKREDGGREVTDPVTHLPIVIRDSTTKDLRRSPENEPEFGGIKKTGTGLSRGSKSPDELKSDTNELQDSYDGMQNVFPPPAFEDAKIKLAKTYQLAFAAGSGMVILLSSLAIVAVSAVGSRSTRSPPSGIFGSQDSSSWTYFLPVTAAVVFVIGGGIAVAAGLQGWLGSKVEQIWKDEVWEAARVEELDLNNKSDTLPESVAWMNSVLASVWPLVNPDLFASLVDMLEDVMQASLPKIVRMVSVDDMGQGSEAVRILGIRWLPSGAAGQSVDEDGNLEAADGDRPNDRTTPDKAQTDDAQDDSDSDGGDDNDKQTGEEKKQKEQDQQAMREGLEAEQGDFVNMELAFVYRARSSGRSIKSKVKNAHLYLKFYLPGGIIVPVWVELKGIVGTARLRLQLTPDPPFFSLCTLTFLGQPQVDLSCVPLSKRLPNLMDVPLISSFVQSSIDAALAEYVAPRSLTLDLKDMLVGDDFKKDTITRGIIVVFIKEAKDFKEGDGGIGPFKGSSDSYVTCSWGKFGKTISSTRVIEDDQNPKFHEWAYMLVSPQEIDAEENLRVQLWDSDRMTADDDLGRVEVDLKELMHGSNAKNQMWDREDRFKSSDPDSNMPGTLIWSVGYYSKIPITQRQLSDQTHDKKIRSTDDLKKHVSETAERKLREATAQDESKEINQQKAQDYKEMEDAMICSAPPDSDHPSGVLSIQIHNITGLQVESLQKRDKNDDDEKEDEDEQADDLPSSYCTIILNHKKIYMTRTKPKNAKPFFNAGTERFIRDWRSAEVMISARDSRERENDALLGVVYLPLAKVFKKRSQVMETYPLVGGVGFGRMRISMVFRSVELQMPKELLGWDYGTLEVKSPIKQNNLPEELRSHRIKIRSNLSRIKMVAGEGDWRFKRQKTSDFLACSKRFATPIVVEFRKSQLGPDSTSAFAVAWLKDIPDEEEQNVKMRVWKGDKDALKRATTSAAYEGSDGEEAVGEIEVTMKFWRGLSGYHKHYAQKGKNADMQNVMEVLDTVNDEIEDDGSEESSSSSSSDSDDSNDDGDNNNNNNDSASHKDTSKKLKTHTNQDSDGDGQGSSSKTPTGLLQRVKSKAGSLLGENDSDDGERGLKGQVRDYKANHKQLHRRHRGVMQWQAARSGDWVLGKVRRGKGKLEGVFDHEGKKPGIETEV